MSDNLRGDVKHLNDSTPEYRSRIAEYRVLFEIEGSDRGVAAMASTL